MSEASAPKLVALLTWKGEPAASAGEHWKKYPGGGGEMQLFGELERRWQVSGWSTAYDAVTHFLALSGKTADAAQTVCGWFDRNGGAEPQADPAVHPLFFSDMDREHDTTYFTSRLRLLQLFSTNEPPDRLWQRAVGIDQQLGGWRDNFAGCVAEWDAHYAAVGRQTLEWVSQYYDTWNPQKNDPDRLREQAKDFAGVAGQEQWASGLLLKYQPELFVELCTWAQWLPPGSPHLREAVVEYFDAKHSEALPRVDSLIAGYAGRETELLSSLVASYDPDYRTAWEGRVRDNKALFPPWRCKDYQGGVPEGCVGPGDAELTEPEKLAEDPRPKPPAPPEARPPPAPPAEPDPAEPDPAEPEAVVSTAAALPATAAVEGLDWRGGEELTRADLGLGDDSSDSDPDDSMWINRVEQTIDAVAPLPEPEHLEYDPKRMKGPSYPKEEEGWLCYSTRRGSKGTSVVIDSPAHPAQRDPPRTENLCAGCSEKVLKARCAMWAPVQRVISTPGDGPVEREGICEVIAEGGFFSSGGGWVKRYIRATHTGLHVYDVDAAGKARPPKAKASRFFTPETRFVVDPKPADFPADKLGQPGYRYFGFVLQNSLPGSSGAGAAPAAGSTFWLRCKNSDGDAPGWVEFFSAAVERFRPPEELGDPNPAKWRGRVVGLDNVLHEAESAAREAAEKAAEAQRRRRDAEKRRAEAEAEREWVRLQATNAAARVSEMEAALADAEEQREAIRDKAAKARHDTAQLRQHAADLLGQAMLDVDEAEAAIESALLQVREKESGLQQAEQDRTAAELEARRVFARWRRCEERAPEPGSTRAVLREGLIYRAPGDL
eukprot:TRINITY_DN25373_c0_g1_i1.p1 TRINITY_DN25373_c0_g1~~TRINITY_DN25373_c0_g1_i1.p1  ORF type:complete len:857 (+),score=286.97 TRINITY_DN25373_c0_g1_i1:78-2573(+)